MKKAGLFLVLILSIMYVSAQTDTVFQFKDNKIKVSSDKDGNLKVSVVNPKTDSVENLLFEGTYGEETTSEITFNYTFQKLSCDKRGLKAHGLGFGFATTRLIARDFKKDIPDAVLRLGFEYYINGGSFVFPLSKRYNFTFLTGLGGRFSFFYADDNTAFEEVDGYTRQVPAPSGVYYSNSTLNVSCLTIPAMFELQYDGFYVQMGLEAGIKLEARSDIQYKQDGKRIDKKVGRGLNVNPVTADVKLGFGIDNMGFYFRYGLVPLFKHGKGANVVIGSFGMIYDIHT